MNNNTGVKQQMLAGEEGEEFIVERIVSHRFRNGRKEYLLAWKGFSEEENTWEPEHNLDCPDLIEDYENRLLQKSRHINNDAPSQAIKRKPSMDQAQAPAPNKRGRPPLDRNSSRASNSSNRVNEEPSAFDRGYEAEKILGATDATGELMLLVQWRGTAEADLVPSRICNVKCPQVVIRFYEERLTWITAQQQQQNNNDTSNHNTSDTMLLTSPQNNGNLLENKTTL